MTGFVYNAPVEADSGCYKPDVAAPKPPPKDKERAEMEG